MTLFSRYVFRQVAGAFLIVLLTLTSIVWLATALKELNLVTSHGQGFLTFMIMTGLTLPSLMALIAPNALLIACLHTLDRLNSDSELIIVTASGAPIWRIGAPFALLSVIVAAAILIANLFITPYSMRELRSYITHVRTDLISQVIQPGRFSSPESGLTFHIRDRSMNQDLLGLLVHDQRDDSEVMSYLAERGRIISNADGAYLVMLDGHIHRYDSKSETSDVQIVAFDQYVLDLSEFGPKDNDNRDLRARERYVWELISPAEDDQLAARNPGQLRSELHDRLSNPLYPIVFALLAVALLGTARTTRESRWAQILVVCALALIVRISGLAATNLLTLQAWAAVLVYAIPLGAILIAGWAAQVRMAPEFRTRLALDKLWPANVKSWSGRGTGTGRERTCQA
jgi:lipopolysaccharide export system permease protein